jgi:hypothetical protein
MQSQGGREDERERGGEGETAQREEAEKNTTRGGMTGRSRHMVMGFLGWWRWRGLVVMAFSIVVGGRAYISLEV